MNKKVALYISLSIIILFIIFMVYDTARQSDRAVEQDLVTLPDQQYEPAWDNTSVLDIPFGRLQAVATSGKGIILGGDSFIAAYSNELNLLWNISTAIPVTALAVSGDTIFAGTEETIVLFSTEGKQIDQWGPFDEISIITSVSANNDLVAFADAGNRVVFILNKAGALQSMAGQPGDHFIIPSPYFDVAFSSSDLITVNPGKRNVEYRTTDGEIVSLFGEAGTSPLYFCGCCNPSHIALLPDGNIVTAEKGINRIKILSPGGEFIEMVAQPANFMASVPVDIAADNEGRIYAANPADSQLYIFKRR